MTPKQPFEFDFSKATPDLDAMVDAVFSSLQSSFITMPRGEGFVEYATFEAGYEVLKKATQGFVNWNANSIVSAIVQLPVVLVVVRSILGFSPPEWADVASQRGDAAIDQGWARTLDRKVRLKPLASMPPKMTADKNLNALADAACQLIAEGMPATAQNLLHRLDKADTRTGATGVAAMANMGVPYAMLLYERFLGRPFASHRDSVSELVGDKMEAPIEDILSKAKITYRKTKRAEKVQGFDQAPDFIVPDEFNPKIVIEAKITEDDGTARDKVTRIQHLGQLSEERQRKTGTGFQVVACIDGRGFGVRREDMRKVLKATHGKVFTLATLDKLVTFTNLSEFAL